MGNTRFIVIIYASLSLIWVYILYNFISRYRKLAPDTPKVNALVKAFMVFSIALMLDSLYWTIHAFSLIGLLPQKISLVLGSGDHVFMIKFLLLMAGIYLVIMLRNRKIEELAMESHEKKEVERLNYKLREINKEILKFAHVIKGISECVFISDLNGNISFINDAIIKILGYEENELMGKSFLDIFSGTEDNKNKIVDSAFNGKYEEELEAIKKNGDKLIVFFSVSIIRDENDEPCYIVGIFRDITQRKLWEEQMVQTQKLSAVGELTAGFAHELNNPLTGIMGFTQFLMLNPKCDDEMKGDLETINREAIRAKDIIQNLMIFATKHDTHMGKVSVNDILKDTIKLINYELQDKNIKLIEDLEPDIPQITGDCHQLQQVFLNIGTNAMQVMEEKGGKLTIKSEKLDNIVKISISDTGPGISPEHMAHLFEPFFTTKKVGEGTGLGLSVSYGIIKQHKGNIYATSKEGEETTFFIELPV